MKSVHALPQRRQIEGRLRQILPPFQALCVIPASLRRPVVPHLLGLQPVRDKTPPGGQIHPSATDTQTQVLGEAERPVGGNVEYNRVTRLAAGERDAAHAADTAHRDNPAGEAGTIRLRHVHVLRTQIQMALPLRHGPRVKIKVVPFE